MVPHSAGEERSQFGNPVRSVEYEVSHRSIKLQPMFRPEHHHHVVAVLQLLYLAAGG